MSAGQGHTPGPWRTGADEGIVYAADGFAVAQVDIVSRLAQSYYEGEGKSHWATTPGAFVAADEAENAANARLIAAAPELLEALSRAPIPGRGEEMMAFRDRQDRWLRDWCNPARAKAKGEPR